MLLLIMFHGFGVWVSNGLCYELFTIWILSSELLSIRLSPEFPNEITAFVGERQYKLGYGKDYLFLTGLM
jgi:hypothetical protein